MTGINLPNERQVGHLTLLRQGRQISIKEYNALSSSERLELVRQAQGKKKYDLLINAVDAQQLTPQLHPQELYLTINELGSEYSVELLMLASTEQITTLLDLDCWDGDAVSPVLSLFWLQLLLATGPDKVCQVAQQIEPEILAIFLKKHLTIIRGIEAYDDDDVENANRLENLYDIEYASEDAAKIIGAFLRVLLEMAQDTYLLLMEMIRSEIAATLEEEVFQNRNIRLADLGFVPSVEARNLYTFTDPEQFVPGGKSDYHIEAEGLQNPAALLSQANPENLLAEVLTNGLSHELATELCMLVNRKMSADGTDISSTADVGVSLKELYDILNLALEQQTGTDVDKAQQLVTKTYLIQLFQHGHSLQLQTQDRAQELLTGPIGPYLDYPEQLFLDALADKPPTLYIEASDGSPSSLQSINTLKNLELVKSRLDQIFDLQRLFTELLPFKLPENEENQTAGLSLSVLFLTAIANRLLGRPFAPTSLAPEDLILLKTQTINNGELVAEFNQSVRTIPQQFGINCLIFIDFCLNCWQEDLHIVDLENLDSTDQLCLLLKD